MDWKGVSCDARIAVEAPGILLREKAFGHDNIKVHSQATVAPGDRQDERLMPQDPAQSSRIAIIKPIETAFAGAVKPVVLPAFFRFQKLRAQHRRRGERHDQRDRHGHAKRNREFAEHAADNPPINRMGMNTATSDMLMEST